MTTITKVLVGLITGLLLVSCNLNIGVKGNGNVQTKTRTVNGSFDAIEVSRGLDVYLTQSENENITVQADENLHNIIKTEIEGGVLKIFSEKNISYSEARKVMVSFKDVTKISASSGSDVYGTNHFTISDLELSTSSGSDMTIKIDAETLDCSSSSGSDLTLTGKTESIKANASSGSTIDAKNLIASTTEASASSGADILVNTTKMLIAKASSGGDITYYGNPEKIEKTDGVSGSIHN